MRTATVWVLVVALYGSYGDTITIVDNIASQSNCEALGHLISAQSRGAQVTHCYAVRKVLP